MKNATDGKNNTGWAVDGHAKKEAKRAAFAFAKPASAPLEFQIEFQALDRHIAGRVKLYATSAASPAVPGKNACAPRGEEGADPAGQARVREEEARQLAAPTVMVMKEMGTAARHLHPRPRRVRQTYRESRCRAPGRLPADADRPADEPPWPRALDHLAGQPAHRARAGEPPLGAALRHRHRRQQRELRHAGRVAEPPGAARLARHRIHPPWLGHQGAAQDDRHQQDLPAIVRGHAGEARRKTPSTAC